MKILVVTFILLFYNCTVFAECKNYKNLAFSYGGNKDTIYVVPLADNVVRIIKSSGKVHNIPEMVYVEGKLPKYKVKKTSDKDVITLDDMMIEIVDGKIRFLSSDGKLLLSESESMIKTSQVQNEKTYISTQSFHSPSDEHLYGLGQFQDNNLDVRGLTRRLTQVNTQISIPFLMSNKGYGLLWNNYGLTDFNPASEFIALKRLEGEGRATTVNVTSTTGGVTEVRQSNVFTSDLEVHESGLYSLMLDVGSSMARRHNLSVDDSVVIDMNNLWLPPTSSVIVHLEKGRHVLKSELTKEDIKWY